MTGIQINNGKRKIQLLVGLILMVNAITAVAKPAYARQFKLEYGYAPSCQACHREGGGTPLNGYGQAFMDKGENNVAYVEIASIDSDGDGFRNGEEIVAKSNPGNKQSIPGNTGNWLDLSSLIPKEVQVLFPAATAWKPLDAILTAKDINAGTKYGVSLTSDDDNTIYIPVADRRPIGTALIFPVTHQDETFFLLMATDRDLNISQILVMNADDYKAAVESKALDALRGVPLQSVPNLDTENLDGSIMMAVKRAGALVYVRLKGA